MGTGLGSVLGYKAMGAILTIGVFVVAAVCTAMVAGALGVLVAVGMFIAVGGCSWWWVCSIGYGV